MNKAKHSLPTSHCRFVIMYLDMDSVQIWATVFHEELAQSFLPHALFSSPFLLIRGLDSRSLMFFISALCTKWPVFLLVFSIPPDRSNHQLLFCKTLAHTLHHTDVHTLVILNLSSAMEYPFHWPLRHFLFTNYPGNKGLVMEHSHDQDRSHVRWTQRPEHWAVVPVSRS